ncbi:MAG: hypothetical protein OXI62_01295 [Chloroflexota bacterium]|nr:hypothetical protein [Chloroflexota bacterium]MCY3581297.1 hypothetical protein [Chloroflexota bacterium]MDE2649339.1 hypothetical protein [Chloroflexota bacterium]MXV92435.1 hypothetical protein [Chloroflexota bacterium]MXX82539.1 hypothetical protein [Chloroflexota bacterium]
MNQTTKTFTYIIGIIMTVAMVGSLILPMLSSQVGMTDPYSLTPDPTAFPEPTMPPPPDISAIDFDSRYLHRSGLFTIGMPSGWSPLTDSSNEGELRASLNNAEAQSVVEVRINKNFDGISDAAGLDGYFDVTWLRNTWSGYTRWDETSRALTDDGGIRIDFNLERGRTRLIARQESWLAGDDIISVRVVTAENAAQELKFLLRGVAETIEWLPQYAGAPFGWDVYYDDLDAHMLRFPADWEVSDAMPGLPATIVSDGLTLAVATFDVLLGSEDEARAWMNGWRYGVEAQTVQAVEVDGAAGYRISYRLRSLDGGLESGAVIALNGTDNRLHVANLRAADLDADLLEATADEYPWLAVLDSFRLAPNLDVTVN